MYNRVLYKGEKLLAILFVFFFATWIRIVFSVFFFGRLQTALHCLVIGSRFLPSVNAMERTKFSGEKVLVKVVRKW